MVVACYNEGSVELEGQEENSRYLDNLLLIFKKIIREKKKKNHLPHFQSKEKVEEIKHWYIGVKTSSMLSSGLCDDFFSS